MGLISRFKTFSASVLGLAMIATPVPAKSPEETAIEQKVEDLRNLLEMASKEGWVELKSRPAVEAGPEIPEIETSTPIASATDCAEFVALMQLTDAPDSYLAQGFLAEAVASEEISEALGQSLSVLMGERWHNDRTVATEAEPQLDFSAAGSCDPSLQVWQVLANPPAALPTRNEGHFLRSFNQLPHSLRERVGIEIALKAADRYDFRGAQRLADTLGDSGLQGTAYWISSPRHILLQARLVQTAQPARSADYLRYLADRDGPEQLAAIDALWALDQQTSVAPALERMVAGTDQASRRRALQRQAVDAVRNRSLFDAAAIIEDLINSGGTLPDGLIVGLGDQLATAMDSSEPQRRIEALDAFMRIEAVLGEDYPAAQPRLAALAEEAMSRLHDPALPEIISSDEIVSGLIDDTHGAAPAIEPDTSQEPVFRAATMSADQSVKDRIDRFNADLATMREVLSRE